MKRKDPNSERNCNTELYFSIASLRDFVISRRLRTTLQIRRASRKRKRSGRNLCYFFFFFFSLKYSFFTALYGSLWFQSAFLKNSRVFFAGVYSSKNVAQKNRCNKIVHTQQSVSVCVCARELQRDDDRRCVAVLSSR